MRSCRGAASITRGHEGWLARTLKARFARVLPHALDRPGLVGGVSLAASDRRRRGDDAVRHGVPSRVPRGQPDDQREHAAGHVARRSRTRSAAGSSRFCSRSRRSWPRRGAPDAPSSTSTCRASRRRRSTSACARRSARARSCWRSCGASFAGLPGTNVTIGQPISHRIDHMLSGTRANIAVKIVGDDLVTLRRLGERVREAMSGVAGRRRSVARTADGHSVRPVRAESGGDRALRAAGAGRRRGDRDELRRDDRRTRVRPRRRRSIWS